MRCYLAVDLGTTGCRSIVFDERLQALSQSYEEYGLITPRENWAEQDAQLWWDMTLRTAKQAIRSANIDPMSIGGISVSSQGITIVPVDRELTPLCNALSWLDVRATSQSQQLVDDWGKDVIFSLTGKPIDPCYTLPKLLWLKENRQDLWKTAWKFLMPMDYLIAKLTGICVTDHSMASGTLLYDLKNCCWSKALLDKYAIAEAKLPTILRSGEKVGTVLPEVAKELGLAADCVVAVGAQDQKCAALGAGLEDGTMTVSLGTAGAITKLWTVPDTAHHKLVGWCGYIFDGTWVTEGVINTAGTCLRWVRDLMFPGESYDTINQEAAVAMEKGSSVLFYPYLNGPSAPDYYPDAQGCFYGVNLASQRGDLAAAVMEGVAFQMRILLEAMDAYGAVERIVLFGGGAKSDLWCRIIANATGLEVTVPQNQEAAGAGAAMLAAMATGVTLSPLPGDINYLPDRKAEYEEKYKKYRSIEKKLW